MFGVAQAEGNRDLHLSRFYRLRCKLGQHPACPPRAGRSDLTQVERGRQPRGSRPACAEQSPAEILRPLVLAVCWVAGGRRQSRWIASAAVATAAEFASRRPDDRVQRSFLRGWLQRRKPSAASAYHNGDNSIRVPNRTHTGQCRSPDSECCVKLGCGHADGQHRIFVGHNVPRHSHSCCRICKPDNELASLRCADDYRYLWRRLNLQRFKLHSPPGRFVYRSARDHGDR